MKVQHEIKLNRSEMKRDQMDVWVYIGRKEEKY